MLLKTLLVWSVLQANPSLSVETAHRYVVALSREAEEHHIDPWIMEAIAFKESRWDRNAIGNEKDGSCWVGLGQIRVQDCEEQQVVALLEPVYNLRAMAAHLEAGRKMCRAKHNSKTSCWLGLYNPGDKKYARAVLLLARKHSMEARNARTKKVDGG
jgi:hypothetical protein